MPARVRRFKVAMSGGPPAAVSRNTLRPTLSQRQDSVAPASACASCAGRNSCHSACWKRRARESRRSAAGSVSAANPSLRAMARPARRPAAMATWAPPKRAASPTICTCGSELSPASSQCATSVPSPATTWARPSRRDSSLDGAKSPPMSTVSTSRTSSPDGPSRRTASAWLSPRTPRRGFASGWKRRRAAGRRSRPCPSAPAPDRPAGWQWHRAGSTRARGPGRQAATTLPPWRWISPATWMLSGPLPVMANRRPGRLA